MKPVTIAPCLKPLTVSSVGGCTHRRTSALDRIVAASVNSASAKALSVKWAAVPAPRSTKTRAPSALSLPATSGVSATRVSLAVSFRTPTTTGMRYILPQIIELWHKGRLSLVFMNRMIRKNLELAELKDDLTVVVQGYPLSQQILRTDVSGMP